MTRLIPLFLSPLLVVIGDEALFRVFGDGYMHYNVWVSLGFHAVNLQTILAGGLVVFAVVLHLRSKRDVVRFKIVMPKCECTQ